MLPFRPQNMLLRYVQPYAAVTSRFCFYFKRSSRNHPSSVSACCDLISRTASSLNQMSRDQTRQLRPITSHRRRHARRSTVSPAKLTTKLELVTADGSDMLSARAARASSSSSSWPHHRKVSFCPSCLSYACTQWTAPVSLSSLAFSARPIRWLHIWPDPSAAQPKSKLA